MQSRILFNRGLWRVAALLSITISSLGCAQAVKKDQDIIEGQFLECQVPRPRMCTKEYNPVCGKTDTGLRCIKAPCESIKWTTYGNACSACNDPRVIGYKPGSCQRSEYM